MTDICFLLNTDTTMICQCNPKVFWWYYRKKYPGRYSATCRLQRQTHNEDSSWRCDCIHVVSAEVMLSHIRLTWHQWRSRRWPGKSGSFPSILQRQRDVRGRRPFPANQREICGEERTPPCTSAQAVMRFPCLCWLMNVWRYLYPFWQKTGTRRRTFRLCIEKRNSRASSVKFVYHPLNFWWTSCLWCLICLGMLLR